MFVDTATVTIKAGDGGDGYVSFRHEKFVDKGGPDGGDGGNGGDVIMMASNSQNTLANFRYQRLIKADSGAAGFKTRKHGRGGEDMIVSVPVGTVVLSESGDVLADLMQDGQQVIIARGGRGGFGNAHFVSSTRQAPRVAEKGEQGQELKATFELKMIADVGLVGLPNAGKSTLLASISNAQPEIADYPFTTLRPNLGMVDINSETSLLFADIPGLIEGASQGKGLGDEFLRHVERTSVLLHLIDAYQDNLAEAFATIQAELKSYKVNLTKRPQIVVITKIEGLDPEIIQDRLAELKAIVPKGTPLFAISALSKQGLKELLYKIKAVVDKQRTKIEATKKAELPVIKLGEDDLSWRIEKTDNGFTVYGRKIERFAARTDFGNVHGTERLRDIMKKMGIMPKLVRQGIEAGQKIHIHGHGSIEF
jgi:GTP-binding protein